MPADIETFLVFGAIAAAFAVGSLIANRFLGARPRQSYLQLTTYECGEEAEGEAQIDIPTQNYTFDIIFVAVDVKNFVLALWALNFRSGNSDFDPMLVAVGFAGLAFAGIYYALSGERRWLV